VTGPDRDEGEIAPAKAEAAVLEREDGLALEDVDGLLEAVDVALEPAAGLEPGDRELGVDGAVVAPDEHLPGESLGMTGITPRLAREGPVDPLDEVRHAGATSLLAL
jgi:hypothetical protein